MPESSTTFLSRTLLVYFIASMDMDGDLLLAMLLIKKKRSQIV